jgi:hypothetical protein
MTFKEEYVRENDEIRAGGELKNKIIKENHKMKSTRRFGWKQGLSVAAAAALVCAIAIFGAGMPIRANAFNFTASAVDVPPDFELNITDNIGEAKSYDELRESLGMTYNLYMFDVSGKNIEKVEFSATSGTFVFGEGTDVTEQDGKFTVTGEPASLVVWLSDDASDGEIELRAVATFKDGTTSETVQTVTMTNVIFSGSDDGAQEQAAEGSITPPRDGSGAVVTTDYFTPPPA